MSPDMFAALIELALSACFLLATLGLIGVMAWVAYGEQFMEWLGKGRGE